MGAPKATLEPSHYIPRCLSWMYEVVKPGSLPRADLEWMILKSFHEMEREGGKGGASGEECARPDSQRRRPWGDRWRRWEQEQGTASKERKGEQRVWPAAAAAVSVPVISASISSTSLVL